MLKIGIESVAYFLYDDYSEGMKKLKSHGYDCVDYRGFFEANSPLYNMDNRQLREYLSNVKQSAGNEGVEIFQLHAVLSRDDSTDEIRNQNFLKYVKAIEGARILGCKRVVIHPLMPFGWTNKGDEDFCREINYKIFSSLMPYAEENNVIVCIENLPFANNMPSSSPYEIKQLVRNIDNKFCRICLDTGHANVLGVNLREVVKLFDDDLFALHVHDNLGSRDEHRYPYFGTIDWDGFFEGLRDVKYNGAFILEVHASNKLPEPAREDMRISLSKLARIMADKII